MKIKVYMKKITKFKKIIMIYKMKYYNWKIKIKIISKILMKINYK